MNLTDAMLPSTSIVSGKVPSRMGEIASSFRALLAEIAGRRARCVLSWIVLPGVLAFPASAQTGDTSWMSTDGITIRARLAGWDGSNVLLMRNGRDYQVPLARLNPESVEKARRLLQLPPGKAVAPAAGKELPEPREKRDGAAPSGIPLPRIADVKRDIPKIILPDSCARPVMASGGRDKHGMPFQPFTERRRIVRTTAYTAGESDHLVYGSLNAVGTTLQSDGQVRSAAADWSFYPVGTRFTIKGLPYLYVVDDYGSALTGTGTIDIYQPTFGSMNQWGCRNVEVTVVRWGSFTRSAAILKRRTGYWHCREMLANIIRQQAKLAGLASR